MKKRVLTKIMALGLAGVMVLGMSVTSFAAIGNDTTGTNAQETGVQEGNDNSVTINTLVVVTNNETTAAEGKTIAYPDLDFKYTVAGATVAEGTTVTDQDDEPGYHTGTNSKVTVQVKSGPADGITVSGGHKDSGTVVLNEKGQEAVLVPTIFTGDISKFEAAGIYRYAITDASVSDDTNKGKLEKAGVVKGAGTDGEYFLDVYVRNNETTGNLEFGGFVLMSENPGTIDKSTSTNTDKKKSGFDEADVITDSTTNETKLDPTQTADLTKNYSYTTYNVTLDKAVKGGLGDKKHGFPFAVAVGVQGTHPTLQYGYEVTGSDLTSLNHTYNALEAIPNDQKMSNGSTLKIWGLSPFATINYTETNDTDSKYQVKVGKTADAADIQTQVEKAKDETLQAWTSGQNVANGYAIGTTATINDDADKVFYTNTLNEISPTGVALRFAPYIIMLGAAFFLIAFTRRRKEEE